MALNKRLSTSSSGSSPVKAPTKRKTARTRAPSASEIARNLSNYEIWTVNQGCEQVSYADLPQNLKADVAHVFDVRGRIPKDWVDKKSDVHRTLTRLATPEILVFLRDAFKLCPDLFSDAVPSTTISELYADIVPAFNAWKRLLQMRKSRQKWSEADFVANVYNVFRSPALRESTYRVNCTMALPQPPQYSKLSSQVQHVLNAKTVIPDCAIFIPAPNVRALSHSAKSPYKTLKEHTGRLHTSRATSFRFQSTPCAQLPDMAGFEFVSSIWEDKKPVHQMLEDAYRQNRMATAASARHLHSLQIEAPVFGLVWANGCVRAHVDWCKTDERRGPIVLSAPYPSVGDEPDVPFHEWQLDKPSDILQVHFLIKNIDDWTTGRFCERVTAGVNQLANDVAHKGKKYVPWRRTPFSRKESLDASMTTESSPLPKVKGRRHRAK
jgi:solute carrier family 25 carnitine/acylcarnitine transporter 20/29